MLLRTILAQRTKHFGVRAIIFFALIAALLGSITSTASAVAMGCRTDPIVKLANGKQIKTSVAISVDAAKVIAIQYTLHMPPEDKAVKVTFQGGALKAKETLSVVYDGAPNTYRVETIVTTTAPGTVTAFTSLQKSEESETGSTGQVLVTEVAR